MRICKTKNGQESLTFYKWIKAGKPEVIDCTKRQEQKSFPDIDWSGDLMKLYQVLSKNTHVGGLLGDYIEQVSGSPDHNPRKASVWDAYIGRCMDWAFDCGWTGELKELDAKKKSKLSLEKIKSKFTKNEQSERDTTREDSTVERDGGKEGVLEGDALLRERKGSGRVLPKKLRSKKGKGRTQKGSQAL